jgi:glycosyltransferase involved in cell wall biosynthesis
MNRTYTKLIKQGQDCNSGSSHPVRILHVLGGLNQGGAETWLMNVLRHIDRDNFQMDFLVHTTQEGAYSDQARALGSKIIFCPHVRKPRRYAADLRKILHEYGPYNVIHTHVHHFSGYILKIAEQANVPIRIVHSHIDCSLQEAHATPLRRLYLGLMRLWISKYATLGLGCSHEAANDLFGSAWKTDPRWQIFYCGIDLTPFHSSVSRAAVRAELGIQQNAFVIGHVGRFTEQKNHRFLVEVAAEVAKRCPDMHLLLIGVGSVRPAIEQSVTQFGLDDRVTFAGARFDVPRLMLGAMDVFVMPSLHEGLPVASIEAQASGLPLVLSDVISSEADIIQSLIRRMKLSDSVGAWADAILEIHHKKREAQSTSGPGLEDTPFNITNGVKQLERIYAGV